MTKVSLVIKALIQTCSVHGLKQKKKQHKNNKKYQTQIKWKTRTSLKAAPVWKLEKSCKACQTSQLLHQHWECSLNRIWRLQLRGAFSHQHNLQFIKYL